MCKGKKDAETDSVEVSLLAFGPISWAPHKRDCPLGYHPTRDSPSRLYEWTYMTCGPDSVHSWSCWNAWIRALNESQPSDRSLRAPLTSPLFDCARCRANTSEVAEKAKGECFRKARKIQPASMSERNRRHASRRAERVQTVAAAPVARCPPRKVKRVWFMSRSAD